MRGALALSLSRHPSNLLLEALGIFRIHQALTNSFVLQIPIGAETVGVGADDLEELEEDDEEYLRLGQEDENEADFSKLQLKPDHQNRFDAAITHH